jgi:hypothetical protein
MRDAKKTQKMAKRARAVLRQCWIEFVFFFNHHVRLGVLTGMDGWF